MDSKLQAVLEKVAKLRALAAGASTQAEAETAAAQAAALIAKYQLDEAQVEMAGAARTEEIEEGDVLWQAETRSESWRSQLASGLAEVHGCGVVIRSARGYSRYRIAGRKSDVAIVRYLFAWLHVEIARLSQKERGRRAKNSFRYGAVLGVLHVIRQARQTAQAQADQGNTAALAIADRSEQSYKFFEAQQGKKLAEREAPGLSDLGAAQRGISAGSNLAPKQALETGTMAPMLGSGGR